MHFGHPRLGSTTGFHGQRCCGLVPWSWIIVCVRKAKSGDYPKVTARNRLAKHGAPFASPLVDRPPRESSVSDRSRLCFDRTGFRCGTHGEFGVADSAFREMKKRNRRQWENALTLAKRRAIKGIIPLITTL